MGFQSGINSMIGMAGAAVGITKGLNKSQQAGDKAKTNVKETIQSKQTGTKMSTRNTIQEVMREATMGRLSDEQINTLAKDMNNKQRKQFKEKYIGEMNNGNKQQDAGNV